jgi:hypothetical protein
MFLLGILAIFCYSPVVGKVPFKINMLIKAATISGMYAASGMAEECRASCKASDKRNESYK